MSFELPAISTSHTYEGVSNINFYKTKDNGLFVTIDTKKLHIRSVESTEKYYDYYTSLHGDKEVVEKFFTGEISTRKKIQERIDNVWAKRWKDDDPYTSLAVFEKDNSEFFSLGILIF